MNLLTIKKELSSRHRNKKELEYYYVNKRLEKSLSTYYEELSNSFDYLDNRQCDNVLKKL